METPPPQSYLQPIFEVTTAASPIVMWLHFGCLATSYGSLQHPMVIRLQFATFIFASFQHLLVSSKKKNIGEN